MAVKQSEIDELSKTVKTLESDLTKVRGEFIALDMAMRAIMVASQDIPVLRLAFQKMLAETARLEGKYEDESPQHLKDAFDHIRAWKDALPSAAPHK